MVRLTNILLGRSSTSTPHPHYLYSVNTWIPGGDSGGGDKEFTEEQLSSVELKKYNKLLKYLLWSTKESKDA